MDNHWQGLDRETTLLPGDCAYRYARCKSYLKRLPQDKLLLYYKLEAGLTNVMCRLDTFGGWDSPVSVSRGMFTGHWLSAASMAYAADGDAELKLRIDDAVDVISRCQQQNGGWAFAVSEKQLIRLKEGRNAVNCLYSFHKTMMGLQDAWRYAQNDMALTVLKGCADYFTRWSDDISRQKMDEIMDRNESGGILEIWARLYAATGDAAHAELMRRFERPALYDALSSGRDFLTNMHVNTTIPEILGAAACYEATGERRYRSAVEAYWDQAVTTRGMYATGGQSCGEVWSPSMDLTARLGEFTQEHCTVYNMIRLADTLLRWTGEAKYADYIERNLLNGVMAQTFIARRYIDLVKDPQPKDYLVSYYLPTGFGATKKWGSETEDFWCCHGTSLQANTQFHHRIYYRIPEGIAVSQYIPSRLNCGKGSITLTMADTSGEMVGLSGRRAAEHPGRPQSLDYRMTVDFPEPEEFTLMLRMPWWLSGPAEIRVDGQSYTGMPGSFLLIKAAWHHQSIDIVLPKTLTAEPLPGEPGTVAFMDGPVVLAGLTDGQYALHGDPSDPHTILQPHDERMWTEWKPAWRTVGQPKTIQFVPLNTITEEQYNLYFPVRE